MVSKGLINTGTDWDLHHLFKIFVCKNVTLISDQDEKAEKNYFQAKISFESALNDPSGMITIGLFLDSSPGLEEIASICSSLLPFCLLFVQPP